MKMRFCAFLWMRAGQDLEGMYVFTLAYCGFGTVNGGFMQTYSDVDQDISRTHWHSSVWQLCVCQLALCTALELVPQPFSS